MRARRLSLTAGAAALAAAFALIAPGCGDTGPESRSEPAPRPLGEASDLPGAAVASPEEQAEAIAGNPRLLLFDLQTALEGVHQTGGAYPSQDEFGATESWALQRAALDAAFDSWTYASDGRTYRLTGVAGGREFGITSPE